MSALQAYEQHVANCKQCGGEDQFETMCDEGFRLLQAALKEDPSIAE